MVTVLPLPYSPGGATKTTKSAVPSPTINLQATSKNNKNNHHARLSVMSKVKRIKKREQAAAAAPLSTSLRCYFECEEVFRKDYQLFLHLKLRHRSVI